MLLERAGCELQHLDTGPVTFVCNFVLVPVRGVRLVHVFFARQDAKTSDFEPSAARLKLECTFDVSAGGDINPFDIWGEEGAVVPRHVVSPWAEVDYGLGEGVEVANLTCGWVVDVICVRVWNELIDVGVGEDGFGKDEEGVAGLGVDWEAGGVLCGDTFAIHSDAARAVVVIGCEELTLELD